MRAVTSSRLARHDRDHIRTLDHIPDQGDRQWRDEVASFDDSALGGNAVKTVRSSNAADALRRLLTRTLHANQIMAVRSPH
jgi:hypothetical protein